MRDQLSLAPPHAVEKEDYVRAVLDARVGV